MDASVDQGPHEDVGEEVLEDESGDELLLCHEVHGGAAGFLDEVVQSQDPGDKEIENEAV